MTERKYEFSWNTTVGADIDIARPDLGPNTHIEVYRLFQFALRDILEQRYGTDMADELLREAGALAGKQFFRHYCDGIQDLNALVKRVAEEFRRLGIGIFRVEKSDAVNLDFTFTVCEDLDCSGMPDTSDVVCVYDEGFLRGILEEFTGAGFNVREVDCWCTGDRTCRFEAKALSGSK
ncbi:4-vinyl reductase [Desulfovibrio sp. OttesenSCG-928-C06]|nr:4-vinyl reductase [Desulfovibrio sp. OttesenSCG-928-C06]